MSNHLVKQTILGVALVLLVGGSAVTSKADAAACAQAVTEAAAALAEKEAACSGPYGAQSGACQMAIVRLAESTAAMAEACPVN